MVGSDIDTKILYKVVLKNRRMYPVKGYWLKATRILYAGYKLEMEQRAIEIENGRNYKYPYLRKPDWIPKQHTSDEIKKFVLKKHIAYAANLENQKILNNFGWCLIKLKENQWVHSKLKKKKKNLSKKIEELLDNPKMLLRARKILNQQRLLKKNKYK